MSKDKRKQEPRDSELLRKCLRFGVDVGRFIGATIPRGYLRLRDLGLVTFKRRLSSSLRPKRYTYVVLTPEGETLARILDAPPKYIAPPHKREPRVEKARTKASDRRRAQPED